MADQDCYLLYFVFLFNYRVIQLNVVVRATFPGSRAWGTLDHQRRQRLRSEATVHTVALHLWLVQLHLWLVQFDCVDASSAQIRLSSTRVW